MVVLLGVRLVLLEKDSLFVGLEYDVDVLVVKDLSSLDKDLDSFYRGDLSGVFVYEVFELGAEHVVRELAALVGVESVPGDGNLVRKVEDVYDVLVGIVSDCSEQGRYGQLFLTVDVSVHHVVDVRRKLDP